MGEFNETVATLLQAFSSGIEVIKRLRRHRKEAKLEVDSAISREERRLNKSLRRNRSEVQMAYSHDRAKLGGRFDRGDSKAHLSLTSILFRLNTGFMRIIERFTKGESTCGDYERLVSLSNSSRVEAINTFGQLSSRLSRSQMTLQFGETPSRRSEAEGRSKHRKKNSLSSRQGKVHQAKHLKSKSSPEFSITNMALKTASPQGRVRINPRRNETSSSTESADTTIQQVKVFKSENLRSSKSRTGKLQSGSNLHCRTQKPQLQVIHNTIPSQQRERPQERASVTSFESDSTKLGEIPDKSRSRSLGRQNHTAFPLNSFGEPTKPRSRLMRLFSRGARK